MNDAAALGIRFVSFRFVSYWQWQWQWLRGDGLGTNRETVTILPRHALEGFLRSVFIRTGGEIAGSHSLLRAFDAIAVDLFVFVPKGMVDY